MEDNFKQEAESQKLESAAGEEQPAGDNLTPPAHGSASEPPPLRGEGEPEAAGADLTPRLAKPTVTPSRSGKGEESAAEELAAAPEEDEETQTAPRRSKKWYIVGGVLLVFLAAAIFLGARMIKGNAAANGMDEKGGPALSIMGGKGGAGGKSVRINMTAAPELPQDRPATNGLFVRREDQSIFIGTGNVMMTVKKPSGGSSGAADVNSHYDGPVVEVVVNHETKVYQDITEMTPPDAKAVEKGEASVQQKVKPGSLDDLGANSMITVWGEKQGDRYIAKVITFR